MEGGERVGVVERFGVRLAPSWTRGGLDRLFHRAARGVKAVHDSKRERQKVQRLLRDVQRVSLAAVAPAPGEGRRDTVGPSGDVCTGFGFDRVNRVVRPGARVGVHAARLGLRGGTLLATISFFWRRSERLDASAVVGRVGHARGFVPVLRRVDRGRRDGAPRVPHRDRRCHRRIPRGAVGVGARVG